MSPDAVVDLAPEEFARAVDQRVRLAIRGGRRPPVLMVRELDSRRYFFARTRLRYPLAITPIVRRAEPLENGYRFVVLDLPHLTWAELPPIEEMQL